MSMPARATSAAIRIATRGSALALAQANTVLRHCQVTFPELAFELKIIKTTGDKLQTASLANQELPKGLFTKELETALLNHEADLAVHSLKDLPTELPPGLILNAVLERADVRDVVIHKGTSSKANQPPYTLASLPAGATIATSSTRREAQLLHHRPDLKIVPIRGNVPTRLKKLHQQPELHGTILAAAGLARLNFTINSSGIIASNDPSIPSGLSAFPVDLAEMLPCVGQAAIGIETRENDELIHPLCQQLTHADTLTCVVAERAFLQGMGGGCQLAVAAYATLENDSLRLRAISFLKRQPISGELTGPASDPAALGRTLAGQLGG